MSQPRYMNWLWLSLLVIVVDQLSKTWVINHLQYGESRSFTSFFNLVYVRNYGAAFSFLSDAGGWQKWLFVGLGVAVTIGVLVYLRRLKVGQMFLAMGLALLVGGALGNVIDRVLYGYVVDFLDFYLVFDGKSYHWPAFNVADMAIVAAAAVLIIDSFREPPEDNSAA